MEEEISLDRLNHLLEKSFRLLGDCASLVRDLEFRPKENLRRIAKALQNVVEVQLQIYEQRPDLAPEDLKDKYRPQQDG
ncbi:MAG: hypothetical protein A2Y61_07930 [Chloroflexi bacterium RBG_13_60_13]|nr:MAG: hypothetical protein A2Y61_07930 [Chloroflexi bacterium RBG_13_60_13]